RIGGACIVSGIVLIILCFVLSAYLPMLFTKDTGSNSHTVSSVIQDVVATTSAPTVNGEEAVFTTRTTTTAEVPEDLRTMEPWTVGPAVTLSLHPPTVSSTKSTKMIGPYKLCNPDTMFADVFDDTQWMCTKCRRDALDRFDVPAELKHPDF